MSNKARLLLIEDEAAMRRFVRTSLEAELYEIWEAKNGSEGARMAANLDPQAILLDLGLPDMDGVELARSMCHWSKASIIVISGRDDTADKVAALDAGADDYLTKPFDVEELQARVRAAVRRNRKAEPTVGTVEAHGVLIDLDKKRVFRRGLPVKLSPREYKLLSILASGADTVLVHRRLLTEVWGPAAADNLHYLRVLVNGMRIKLEEDPSLPKLLITEHGVGYRLSTV